MSEATDTLPDYDAWVFARLIVGHALNGELAAVSAWNRPLADRLAGLPPDGRRRAWDAHLEDVQDGDAWIVAVAAVDPEAEAPEVVDGWGPLRLEELPPVEPFPVDVFTAPVQRLVLQGAEAIGCPVDFLAVPALAVAGGVIGRTASLKLKEGYFANGCSYVAAIGPPSDGKTPALKIVAAPIRRIDEALAAEWAEAKAQYDEGQGGSRVGQAGQRQGRGDECGSSTRAGPSGPQADRHRRRDDGGHPDHPGRQRTRPHHDPRRADGLRPRHEPVQGGQGQRPFQRPENLVRRRHQEGPRRPRGPRADPRPLPNADRAGGIDARHARGDGGPQGAIRRVRRSVLDDLPGPQARAGMVGSRAPPGDCRGLGRHRRPALATRYAVTGGSNLARIPSASPRRGKSPG